MHCHWMNSGPFVKLHTNCLPSKYNEIASANLEECMLQLSGMASAFVLGANM